MTEFVVHGVADSPYVRTVRAMFEEKQTPYALAALPSGVASVRSADHLVRHPFGRIPVLEHGDFRLYETQAILRYLDAVLPGTSLTPKDPRAQARMNQLMGIVDWYVMPSMSAIAFQRLMVSRRGAKPDDAIIEKALPMARTAIAEIDRLSDGQPYLTGARVSLADLMLAPHYYYFSLTPEGKSLGSDHPRLGSWLARMETHPSMKATAPQL